MDERKERVMKQLYNVMRSMENKLGGGEGIEGIYGSITQTGCSKIMHSLGKWGLKQGATLVDIGAGLGRPLLHALYANEIKNSWGIEIDPVKCDKAKVGSNVLPLVLYTDCFTGIYEKNY